MVTPAGPGERTSRRPRPWARIAIPVLIAGVVLLLVGLEPLRVASVSMEPTLTAGDHVLVDKLSGRWRMPEVGDLVVFRDPEHRELVVKRVVALGGQTVALEDAVLVVDGIVRHEPQVDLTRIDSTYFGPVTVPPDAAFLLGDNRSESVDSRRYGAIRLDELIGRVLLTF
ncbi:signal peptidase I [Fodinibacter luteus]|uniref:Signal peptidase I n=1 Tax=Fodinibacter luteus TaxID=552064 RepID=A0ABP8KR80_9MICO